MSEARRFGRRLRRLRGPFMDTLASGADSAPEGRKSTPRASIAPLQALGRVLSALDRDHEAHGRVLSARNRDHEAHGRVLSARNRDHEAHGRVLSARNRDHEALGRVLSARNRDHEAHGCALSSRNRDRDAHGRVLSARNRDRDAHGCVLSARNRDCDALWVVLSATCDDRELHRHTGAALDRLGEADGRALSALDRGSRAYHPVWSALVAVHEAHGLLRVALDRTGKLAVACVPPPIAIGTPAAVSGALSIVEVSRGGERSAYGSSHRGLQDAPPARCTHDSRHAIRHSPGSVKRLADERRPSIARCGTHAELARRERARLSLVGAGRRRIARLGRGRRRAARQRERARERSQRRGEKSHASNVASRRSATKSPSRVPAAYADRRRRRSPRFHRWCSSIGNVWSLLCVSRNRRQEHERDDLVQDPAKRVPQNLPEDRAAFRHRRGDAAEAARGRHQAREDGAVAAMSPPQVPRRDISPEEYERENRVSVSCFDLVSTGPWQDVRRGSIPPGGVSPRLAPPCGGT
jgi:hypothetical protein